MQSDRWWRAARRWISGAVLLVVGVAILLEGRTWWLQSELLSAFARELSYAPAPGAAPAQRFPSAGPHNRRLGYVDLPRFVERLQQRGYLVAQQARLSPTHRRYIDQGGFAIYREKGQAGLTVRDRQGALVAAARYPGRVYPDFAAVPPLVVQSLLFIENRELLDPRQPRRNPAVEWDRLAVALPGLAGQVLNPGQKVAGGSTLATQIEKFRHSADGQTRGAADKLRQMVSASLRAYAGGVDTRRQREQLIVDYLNATPLSAQPGFGEINGLGDGLWAWFGTGFEDANRILARTPKNRQDVLEQATVYKQALALLLAQRRPSHYLLGGRADLAALTERYLRLLIAAGVLDPELGTAALTRDLAFRAGPPPPAAPVEPERDAAHVIRTHLLGLLDVPSLYQLDRLDLQVEATVDLAAQQRIAALLRQLSDPEVAARLGLYGPRLLAQGQAHEELVYSFTLYERGAAASYLRVQTDNLDQPFDVSEGAKLDLGSTAKLRTLITYLEIVAGLHGELAAAAREPLRRLAEVEADPLAAWVASRLLAEPGIGLPALLEAAMARRYSASPAEAFRTGGGIHRFANFDRDDDHRVVTVAEAFRRSINLPFIRLMRDIVRHHLARAGAGLLEAPDDPARLAYLERFADREGRTYLKRFLDQLQGLDADQRLARLAGQMRPRAERLAVLFRSLRPAADPAALAAFLACYLAEPVAAAELARLYEAYGPNRFSLNDRAYLTGLHPLQLWLAAYLERRPTADRAEVVAASAAVRQESYAWLFKTRHKGAQDRRIRTLLEEEAFAAIHAAWRRLGYPFDRLVPSYATAIGSSADRPDALAELIGLILNDGVWTPPVRVARLTFAAGTPFETVLERGSRAARPVLAPAIARVVRAALVDVVEAGTATRLRAAFHDAAGGALALGAKTGTGDHRRKSFDRAGRVTGSAVVSRSATVVFFIGERLFGNLTIYVLGPAAAEFTFTSSLPAQLLKALAPAIQPLLDGQEPRTAEAGALGGA